jgi:tRNA threonylcarbamoyladenosine biosynthesis protein TsaB
MRVLAIDTSTTVCSVAVVAGERIEAEAAEYSGNTHARHLMARVEEVMAESGRQLADLDGIAVAAGPGSFTGLRIGIATAQGLAMAAGVPIVGISSLEAAAWSAPAAANTVCAMLDARRKEVYVARFDRRDGVLVRAGNDRVARPEAVIADMPRGCCFIGTGVRAYRDRIAALAPEASFPNADADHWIRAAGVASLAQPLLAGNSQHLQSMVSPRYIRKSDAEMHAAPARIRPAG